MASDVSELKVSEIAEQSAVAIAGDAQVDKAVVIEIAGGDTTGDTGEGQLRVVADVVEAAIRQLLQELQQGVGFFRCRSGGESGDEQVGEAIVIEVSHGTSAGHDQGKLPGTADAVAGRGLRRGGLWQSDDLETVLMLGCGAVVGCGLWLCLGWLAAVQCEYGEQGHVQEVDVHGSGFIACRFVGVAAFVIGG